MTKQEILDEAARRIGEEDTAFKTTKLSPAFDWVIRELAQDDCLSLTRKVKSFTFEDAACTIANSLMDIDTAALLALTDGELPERIDGDLLVPSWGINGRIVKKDDAFFEEQWLTQAATPGRPRIWRIYPSLANLQLWPAPDDDNITATCLLTWVQGPTTLEDADDITEILPGDMPTILAGLFQHGIMYRDETLNDAPKAFAEWEKGKLRMRERKLRVQHYGRENKIRYSDF